MVQLGPNNADNKKVGEVEEELRKELCGAVFVDTPEFLEKLSMSRPSWIDDIYEKASGGKKPRRQPVQVRMAKFPPSTKTEINSIAICQGSNFITQACPAKAD